MTAIERYRSSRLHRCCNYCAYCKIHLNKCTMNFYTACVAKDKALKYPELIRPFCPCFKLDEQKCLDDEPLATLIISPDSSEKIDEVAAKLRGFMDKMDKCETYKIMIGKEN